jgi:serine/threonine protein kinase
VAEENAKVLRCVVCRKEYPAGTIGQCPDDQAELLADPLIGTVFADKYEILSLLGEGGMSRVYKARHTFMNRVVAIKLLYDCARDSVAKARFQQEAEAASALSHPNVVTVHDFGLTAAGQPYFIMDCLEGESLADILAEKRCLRLQKAVEIFTQACDGLDHAHRKGIIHRDIKPSNLVIIKQEDGYNLVKLVDFGIAKLVSPERDKVKQKRITQTGEVFGTPAYMSPEQCNGRTMDARSDIYSFGCLMYESLAGEPPLLGDSFVATVVKHVSERPAPLSEKSWQKVPPVLEVVIMKCLEKNPDDRYHSAAELKQALLDAAFVSGLKGLRVGAVQEPRSLAISGAGSAPKISVSSETSRRQRRKNLVSMAVVAAALASGCCWVLFGYPGAVGDTGTFYDKLWWQAVITRSDEFTRNHRYPEAVAALEAAARRAKTFGDDNRRLEFTLNKLVDAYATNHESEKVEQTNAELARLDDRRADAEYDALIERLKRWREPTQSSVKAEEQAQQAQAFAERISRCADKLATRSRQKQENLLKIAARTYDLLNLREGIYRTGFRIQLARIYRSEHRGEELHAILHEALEHAAVGPQTEKGWRCKIQVNLLSGELNLARGELDEARKELDNALTWTRAHLGADRDLLCECLNISAHLYSDYHTLDCDARAAALAQEAERLSKK